jgi:hypothetical protein
MLPVYLSELKASQATVEKHTLTFEKAFRDKRYKLSQKLDVTNELLRKLKDANIVDSASFERIKKIDEKSDKADELLKVVQRRDDSLLPEFSRILIKVDQLAVVKFILPDGHHLRFELIPEELDTELVKTIEPRYGLPRDLYSKEVIDLRQHNIIDEASSVDDCVFHLLKAVRQNFGHVKDKLFLQALNKHDQLHVVNFINTDGKISAISGDVRPLNEQQRRRLWSTQDVVIKLNLQEGKFLDLLQAKKVLSNSHKKDVENKCKQGRTECVQLLLQVLERRSLANLNHFIECLCETKQFSIVQWLSERGAVGCLRSAIDQLEITAEEEDMEARLEEVFYDFISQNKDGMESRLCKLMEKNGFKIMSTRKGNSIIWYIMCRTVQKLESLRWLYESPTRLLANILQCFFTLACGSTCSLQLSLKWTTEDYENCKRFLTETSGRPFDLPKYRDTPPLLSDFSVSI